MKRNFSRQSLSLVASLFLCCCGVVCTEISAAEAKKLVLSDLPAAVQKMVQSQLNVGGGKVGEIDREEDDGEISYVVEIVKGEDARDMTVSEEGKLLGMEVDLNEVPAVPQKAIRAQLGNGTIDSVEKTSEEDGTISYEVEMTNKAGKDRFFTVTMEGKMIRAEIGLEEAPVAVRKTIEVESAKGKLESVYRVLEEDGISYSAEVNEGGRSRDMTIAGDGKLETIEAFASDLPPLGRKVLHGKVGNGKLVRIDKVFDEKGEYVYEVESLKDGKAFNFKIGAGGRFRGMDGEKEP
ncbi:PepSY-like domain-containing protein [Pedosphaera parvula]|uniref:Putative beta-lactamase-inhibitor-like PepSY-like domain-containing protein n=1 Tax=Pedosphaera parvula (strain Ellin514) TaxID=320771 RepID=B9XID0_PEDPL|nr:hypothetical protein [Pedosphaera parvula]EEF60391.1 hypothetical protein Cflav_PD3361 [Pedosphaera parvula Ellin514]